MLQSITRYAEVIPSPTSSSFAHADTCSHSQLAALCQLGEKLSIIGELGKLLVSEIPLERTEPGHDRAIYTSESHSKNTRYFRLPEHR